MREEWVESTLKEATDLITCGVAARPQYVDNGVPFLSSKNVKNGRIIWDDYKLVSKETHAKLTKHNKPLIGDLLYTRVGSFGEAAIVDRDIEFSIFVSLTLIKPKELLRNTFLRYYLNSPLVKKLAAQSISGSGVGNLNVGTVRKFSVLIPPLPEQDRIVAILDEAFTAIEKAIANTEKNITNARELFESELTSLYIEGQKWPQRKLSDITTDFGRGRSRHRPRNAKHLYGGPYPFIQTGDIRNSNHVITEYSQTYSEAGLAQSKMWPVGTVCITIAANIAETGILGFDACFPDSVIGVVVDEIQMSNRYLEFLLQAYKARLQSEGKGSAQDNINLGTFETLHFPVPTLQEQEQTVRLLDEVNNAVGALESIYATKVMCLSNLKQSILHKAFTGELTADHVLSETEALAG